MEPRDQQVVTRIGFAEQWLNRAKRQCAEGNLARGWLTLVLADAEMRHALRAADPAMRPPRPRAVPALLAGAVVVAAVVVVAARWPGDQTGLSVSPAPPIVRLAAPGGPLLELAVPPSATADASVAKAVVPPPAASRPRHAGIRRAPQAAASGSGGSTVAISASPALPPSPAAAPATVVAQLTHSPQSVTSQTAAPPVASRSPLELSAGDLIDLVLAAERTLRGDANRP